jgi:hypothetical protein
MNDLYEYKANKYKLKYLKLKRKYIAEGGTGDVANAGDVANTGDTNNDINCLAIRLISENDFQKLNIKKIYGDPTYSNATNIPVDKKKKYFYDREYLPQEYKDNVEINKIVCNLRYYEGRLLSLKNYENYKIIKECDPDYYNTPKIMYIGEINYNYKKIHNFNFNKLFNKMTGKYSPDYKIITTYFNYCPEFLKRENITYKYMIREIIKRDDDKNIFKNLKQGYEYYHINDSEHSYYINDNNIKLILVSLQTGIINLITNLYNKGYILDTINEKNMILKEEYILVNDMMCLDSKVYFIDFTQLKMYTGENQNNDIKALGKFIYWLFTTFKFSLEIVNKNTLELVKKLYEDVQSLSETLDTRKGYVQSNQIKTLGDLSDRLGLIINSITSQYRCRYLRVEEALYIDSIKK